MKLLKKVAKLSKKEKYILACSFGPDSMALFHYLINNGYNFEIAHVNYHILKQANDDEKGIKDYAKQFNVPVHVLSTFMPSDVNEEMWAREIRYKYFEELGLQLGIKNILIAHNEGDNIETYLLQKERGGTFLRYGLEKVKKRGNVKLIRPLLKIKKDDLEMYCRINDVPFSIDPSNYDVKFKRNKIRADLRDKTDLDKKAILVEIKEKNLQNKYTFRKFKELGIPKYINTTLPIFNEVDDKILQLLLISLLEKHNLFLPISLGRSKNLLETIKLKKTHHLEKINDQYYLSLDYGIVRVIKKAKTYNYVLTSYEEKNCIFQVNKKSKYSILINDSFPLTIKPAIEGKEYLWQGMMLKVNREFISRKMPLYIRNIWPGIYDKNGKLIYVPRYQEKVKKNGLLKFKLKELL